MLTNKSSSIFKSCCLFGRYSFAHSLQLKSKEVSTWHTTQQNWHSDYLFKDFIRQFCQMNKHVSHTLPWYG